MPATIHPIDTDRHGRRHVDDLDHGDHGNGRRPPTDKRTGGGGDNDNWSDRSRGCPRPRRKAPALPPRRLLRARRRPDVLRRHRQRLLRLPGQRPLRRLQQLHQPVAAHRHPARPLAQHRRPHPQLRHRRDRPPQDVPHLRRDGGVVRPRPPHLAPRHALARRHRRPRPALPRRTMARLVPARAAARLLPLQPEQPLLLPDHRRARRPPLPRRRRARSPRCSACATPNRSKTARSWSTARSGTGTRWASSGSSSSSFWPSSNNPAPRNACTAAEDQNGTPMPRRLTTQPPPRLAASVLLACALTLAAPAHAQGCALCRDNAASTPPQTQTAYRHAIVLLGGTGSAPLRRHGLPAQTPALRPIIATRVRRMAHPRPSHVRSRASANVSARWSGWGIERSETASLAICFAALTDTTDTSPAASQTPPTPPPTPPRSSSGPSPPPAPPSSPCSRSAPPSSPS